MPEPTGSALLAGNPPAPPADGGNPPPAPPAPGGEGGAPPAAGGSWVEGLGVNSPELVEWAGKKGWKTPADALASHRELEKMLGGEKIPVPKSADDKVAWDLVHKALARPDAPDGYGLDKIEGADPEFVGVASKAFHEAGLSAAQAAKLAGWWGEQQKAAAEAAEVAKVQQAEVDLGDLRKEWGPSFDSRVEAGRRAALAFGVDADTLTKIEGAVGTKGLLQLMANVGMKLTEAPARGMQETRPEFMTPELASKRIDQLKADAEWREGYLRGDSSKREEMARLQKIAVGG